MRFSLKPVSSPNGGPMGFAKIEKVFKRMRHER